PFRISERSDSGELPEPTDTSRITDLVDWEIVLGFSEIRHVVESLHDNNHWRAALPGLLSDLTSLLREALDLMRQLEGADDRSDGSYWHQPSIAEHPQNQKFREWTLLIDLTRDAFIATTSVDPNKAHAEVGIWLSYPYPLFRRLAFYAATATDLFSSSVSLQW